MPLRFEIKKKLNTRTERVKSVCLHPSEPWVLSALYSGNVIIHDYNTQSVVKTIEASSLPIRCAKFVVRNQWVLTAGDDMNIRAYNYNTLEKIKVVEAHTDYIRYLAVHPSLPYVLSASDDMTVKLWDWSQDWIRLQTFEGHAHYVMMCQWNPKDTHIFATASLDRAIRVWGISSGPSTASSTGGTVTQPHFSLMGHERGVNCIEYSPNGERPYLVSGSDDKTVRVWDYQTKQCIQVLTGHTKNVCAAAFHPHLPILLSGAEDGTVRIWHSATYRLETTLNYMMDRVWSMAVVRGGNAVAVGFDEGTMVVKLGSDAPICSMHAGKVIWSRGVEIQSANVKLVDDSAYGDGERLPLSVKDMGTCEIFPQTLSHHPSGRFIVVCGDGEYIVYTAQALRNKTFGRALDFVWSPEGHYATRDETGKITIFRNFTEHFSFKPPFVTEELFGGRLIGLRASEFICFYDWEEYRMVRRIDVVPRYVFWSDSGDYVALACSDCLYILRHDKDAIAAAITGGVADADDGIEIAFDLEHEVSEKIETAVWASHCFVYITSGMRLQTIAAGQVETLAFLDRPMYILGYLPEQSRLYLLDRELSVVSYQLCLALVEYQSAIARRDFTSGEEFFAALPTSLYTRAARFLEHQGHKEHALQITQDADHKFELALSLGKLQMCAEIIKSTSEDLTSASLNNSRWKQLGDVAIEQGNFPLALGCFTEANDYSGMLLIYTSLGDSEGLRQLAAKAADNGKINIAVMSYLLLRDVKACVEVMINSKRLPEAAFFARTYCPSQVTRVLTLWRQDLASVNEMVAQSLADPSEHPDMFPDFALSIKAEQLLEHKQGSAYPPAKNYMDVLALQDLDVLEEIKAKGEMEVRKMFDTTTMASTAAHDEADKIIKTNNANDNNNTGGSYHEGLIDMLGGDTPQGRSTLPPPPKDALSRHEQTAPAARTASSGSNHVVDMLLGEEGEEENNKKDDNVFSGGDEMLDMLGDGGEASPQSGNALDMSSAAEVFVDAKDAFPPSMNYMDDDVSEVVDDAKGDDSRRVSSTAGGLDILS
eukprot:GHVS01053735.1.p1 GENE.GHVS01053735.1~~GHVS01053735.1.p1  ORF type:complete len:1049 (-),score=156.03 GHVS01053735.1:77-3223(-)